MKLPQTEERTLLIMALTCLGFTVFTALCAVSIGGNFALPGKRLFIIIGTHSIIPISLALISYLLYQGLRRNLWQKETLARVTIDISIMLMMSFIFYLHLHLKAWVPLINPVLYDDWLWQSDLALQPFTSAIEPLRLALAKLPYFDWFYQFIYIKIFMLGFILVAYVNRPLFQRLCLAFMFTIILGCIGYLLMPALGPFLYETGFNEGASKIQAEVLKWYEVLREQQAPWLNAHLSDMLGASLAAMPSLHVAYSFLMLWAIWQTYRFWWMRGLYLIFFLLVICESVWSKWHYWIDAPAGIAIALMSLWLVDMIIGENDATPQTKKSRFCL